MLGKIKFYLFQLMLTKRKSLLLISLLVLGGLFFGAQAAQAWLDIPYNIAANQLERLDWIENSILRYLVFLVILAGESTTFLFISATLLDWSSSLEVGLDNLLVNTGWNFISGLVNISFILIFLYIALAYIFGWVSYGMKQALPRLIIVALLINFSLLLVGMMVDIGWILQGSFKDAFFGDRTIREAAMQPLIDSGAGLIFLTGILGVFLASMLIPLPFVGVAGMAAMAAFALTGEFFFGMISQVIVLIAFNFVAALIFLIYAALFLIRVVVIWLLAIFAPLAFVALILPKTQKFFNDWLRILFQWTFLGIVVYFLMGLGIMLFGVVTPGAEEITEWPKRLGGWNFIETHYKYIFLFVYLIVVLIFAKKLMPLSTDVVWTLAERGMKKGGQVTADLNRKAGIRATIWALEKEAKETARLAELRAKPQLELTPKEATELRRLGGWGSRALRKVVSPRMPPELREAKAKELREKLEEDKKKEIPQTPAALFVALLKELRKGVLLRDKMKVDLMEKSLADKRPDQIAIARELADPKAMRAAINEAVSRNVPEALARAQYHEKMVKEVMDKINDADFVKNSQAATFKDPGVAMNVLKNEGLFREMERRGSPQKKKEMQNTLETSPAIAILRNRDQDLVAKRQDQMSKSPRWPKD